MTIHELKCCTESFLAILQGHKKAEIRKDDRIEGFNVGDVLHLSEWQPEDVRKANPTAHYTGRECLLSVTHVLRGPAFGVPEYYAMLSFDVLRKY